MSALLWFSWQVQCESSPIILHSSSADEPRDGTLNESDTPAIVRKADGWGEKSFTAKAFFFCPSIMMDLNENREAVIEPGFHTDLIRPL